MSRAGPSRGGRWLGIDFSGNWRMWSPTCWRSNVWIADVRGRGDRPVLHDLRRVQELPGDAPPFSRLAALLRAGEFRAAGIDAPFSVPEGYAPDAGHAGLLDLVGGLPCPARHPFPDGSTFISALTARRAAPGGPKPLRVAERDWQARRLNVRSTLWNGPRPGAPMTAACLALLREARRPLWPWAVAGDGLLVEAFPAAQLSQWGLPCHGYGDAAEQRALIADALSTHLDLDGRDPLLQQSADAIDAVVAAFAAISVTESRLAAPPPPAAPAAEGWIAVHR